MGGGQFERQDEPGEALGQGAFGEVFLVRGKGQVQFLKFLFQQQFSIKFMKSNCKLQ